MINNILKRTFSTGSLLTWGETTYGWGRPINDALRVPDFVEGFKDVSQVATGPYHMAFISQSSGVYSVGLGNNGRLGHNSETTLQTPERIDFFHSNKITVQQLACGTRHNLALSSDGQIFSWGFGGGSQALYPINKWWRKPNPLGNGVNIDCFEPRIVSLLEDVKIKSVAAGQDFSLVLAENGKVYGWGQGLHNLGIDSSAIPQEVEDISFLADKKHSAVKKICSSHTFTFLLFENGSLYTCGRNNGGVLGTRANPLVRTDNWVSDLTLVNDQFYKGEKVEDLVISANSMVILTDTGRVYYSGMHVKFRPEPFPVSGNVKKIFATYDSVGFIDHSGKVQFINDQIIDDADKNNGVYTCEDPKLNNVIDIGGNFTLRYALVQE